MIDYTNVAKKPARFIIITYAIIQAVVYLYYNLENTHYRLITSAVIILVGILVTNIKNLKGLHLSILVPLSTAVIELASVSLLIGGNRTIYIFLIGCSLVSLLYVSVTGLVIMTSITTAVVAIIIFGFKIRLLESGVSVNNEIFSFFAMVFVYVVILVLGNYSIGMLNRSQRTKQRFDKVLEGSSSLIVIVNNQARVEYISKSFAEILGIEKQEYAINLPFVDLFPYIELRYFFGELLEYYGTIHTTFEMKINNDIRSFMLHSIPMGEKDPRNEIIGIARFFDCVEITPIIESQRAAEAATRSKSEFLAMMSHEIRTPLNAIIGISQIQLENGNLPEKYAAAQEKILSSGNNLLGIINDILDMSKIETGKLHLNITEYDMRSLINDTVQLNIVRIGSKPIEFKLDIYESLPAKLYGDELRLKQILNNLLSNAIKYTEKGYVKLSIKHEITEDYVNLNFLVEDTGQGLKQEDKEKMFTEYLRFNAEANRNTEGTGLGLNITQKLAETMEGAISVESEWGKGSIFKVTVRQKMDFYMPIGKDTAHRLCNFTFNSEQQAARLQLTREPMPYGNVLIVDDVETNLFVAEGLLKPYKLNIDTADSGFAAIDKVKDTLNGTVKKYDIIFMDHMMPQMDGIETTKKIRELEDEYNKNSNNVPTHKRIPIIALTANALTGNDVMFAQNNFDGFIPKPIDMRLLNTALNKFVRDCHPEEAANYIPEIVSYITPEINPKMIQVFCSDAEKAINTFKNCISNNDIKLFTITAHAMKSALANIGEHEISQTAFALEKAGINGDMEYILANNENLIKTFENLIKKFKVSESAKTENIEEDTVYLKEQLLIIKTACQSYDDDTAYAALDRLKEKTWSAKTSGVIEQIRDMLYIYSDFDGIVKQIEELH